MKSTTPPEGETKYVDPGHSYAIVGVRVGTTLVCESVDGDTQEVIAVRIDTNEHVRVSVDLWKSLPLERRTDDLDKLTVDDISSERAEEVIAALVKRFYGDRTQKNPFRITDDLESACKFAKLAIGKHKQDSGGGETGIWEDASDDFDLKLLSVVQQFY